MYLGDVQLFWAQHNARPELDTHALAMLELHALATATPHSFAELVGIYDWIRTVGMDKAQQRLFPYQERMLAAIARGDRVTLGRHYGKSDSLDRLADLNALYIEMRKRQHGS